MATDTRHTPSWVNAERPLVPARQGRGVWGWCRAFFARLSSLVRRMFASPKSRCVPVVHEDVALTPEGAEVWKKATDPASPVGKPAHHRRRRLTEG